MKTFLVFVLFALFVFTKQSDDDDDAPSADNNDGEVNWSDETFQQCKNYGDENYDKCVGGHGGPTMSTTCTEDPTCVEEMYKRANVSVAAAMSAKNLTQCPWNRKLACFADVVETGELQVALKKEVELRCVEYYGCVADRFDEDVAHRLRKFWLGCRYADESISDMNPSCTLSTVDLVEPCIRRTDFSECVRSLKDKITRTIKFLCGAYEERRCARIQEKADRFESAALKVNYPITKCTHFSCVALTLKAIRTSGDEEICTTDQCRYDLKHRTNFALFEISTVDFFTSCDINQDFSAYKKCVHELKVSLHTEYAYLCSWNSAYTCRSIEEKPNATEAVAIAAKNLHDCKDLACVKMKRTTLNETAEVLRKLYCRSYGDKERCGDLRNAQFPQLVTVVDDWTPCFANPEHAKCITTTPKSAKPTASSAGKSKTPQNAKIQNAEISENSENPEEQSKEQNSSGAPYLSIFSITLFVCLSK
ncbi:hypothetical protein B9Z55_012220 [Caenorhabditis nigoni]|uniref:DUF19 domain-containing protein n=1 Tax=Caenorhabditis nigoni TaxID=1611254 RepID=A0A2G5TW69_9PELO|nr:hypothetical protein B9Z55_012220 [Caenorhabditis nigoni]